MLEIAVRVVSRAVIELYLGAVHLNLQMAVAPVFQGIVAREAQDVVRGGVFLNLRKHAAEIVGIEKGLAARIGGKRCQRLLRTQIVIQIVQHGLAGIRRLPVQAGCLGFAAWRKGLEPAPVHRIDGDVGLHGGGGRPAKCRLIVHAGLADSIAEINEALLLRELAERLHQGLQRQQFAVRAEGVVVRVVGREGAAGLGLSFGTPGAAVVESLAFSGSVCGKGREDSRLVIREIQVHAHVRGQRD